MDNAIIKGINEGTRLAAHAIWSAMLSLLVTHWIAIIVFLFVLFTVATVMARFGWWGSLGSFIYNLLYFGTIFAIGLIWGPEAFTENSFKTICTILLYPACYFVTGKLLHFMKAFSHR